MKMEHSFYKSKKVFVSGGAGVIGTELVHMLHRAGARIFVGDLKPRPLDWPVDIGYRQGDLNFISQDELDHVGPEIFFHLAASFERSTESYEFWNEQWHNNILLSHHLMTLLKDSVTLKKVVFPSSYLIYDKDLYSFEDSQDKPCSLKETDSISPRNLTGSAKLNHEIELEFIRTFKNIKVVNARIYRSFGKDSRDVISRWVRLLLERKQIDVYHPENIFDFIYAGDGAEGLLHLGAVAWSGTVNLGSGRAHKVADVVAILKKHFPALKQKNSSVRDPFEASQADTTLLQTVIGWRPATSLEEAIQKIIAFEKNRATKTSHESRPNVLITSIAKKVPLVRAVRRAMNMLGTGGLLYGGDTDSEAISRYFVDRFWKMPKTRDKYLKHILSYLKKENIKVVIPTRDGELAFWSKHRKTFERVGVTVMVSKPSVIKTTLDKFLFYRWSHTYGFPTIKTSQRIEDITSSRYAVKEQFGAGSLSLGLNLTKQEAIKHAQKLEHPIFQPFVNGVEYSADVYTSKRGKVQGVIVRQRNVVVDGESQVTTVVRNEKITRVCSKMAEKLGLWGHSVFQVFLDARGKVHVIECNARFGGASTAGIAAGLDSYYWFLLEVGGQDIYRYPFISRLLTMVRHKEDLILPCR